MTESEGWIDLQIACRRGLLAIGVALLHLLFAVGLLRADGPVLDAAPAEDAVRGIVRAFDRHPVVAIGETHWLEPAGRFYRTLVANSEFRRRVDYLVVEFATPRSQGVLDRYVAGDDIPAADLRRVWRDTTKVFSWDSPIYSELLTAVRDANRDARDGRRLRVLGGDTPVDWARLRIHDDWLALGDNNVSFAKVVTGEVLDQRRKALVILGSNHLTRSGTRDGRPNAATRIEESYPGSLFVVLMYDGRPGGLEARLSAGSPPCLYALNGPGLGAVRAGRGRLADLANALLYLGPPSALKLARPDRRDLEPEYLRELDRRSRIEWNRPFDLESFLR
jgi:hypothetical protein